MIHELTSESEFQSLLAASESKPVFLLKHSTACGISFGANRRFEEYALENDTAEYWRVLVREQRDLSLAIAQKTGVRHQSPQVILFRGGRTIWSCSHHEITEANLDRALSEIGQ